MKIGDVIISNGKAIGVLCRNAWGEVNPFVGMRMETSSTNIARPRERRRVNTIAHYGVSNDAGNSWNMRDCSCGYWSHP